MMDDMTTTYDDDNRPSPTAEVREYDGIETPVDLPMPRDIFDGKIVVASCWYTDCDYRMEALLLLLNAEAPYYRVGIYDLVRNRSIAFEDHPNIVPAVRDYEQCGGDY